MIIPLAPACFALRALWKNVQPPLSSTSRGVFPPEDRFSEDGKALHPSRLVVGRLRRIDGPPINKYVGESLLILKSFPKVAVAAIPCKNTSAGREEMQENRKRTSGRMWDMMDGLVGTGRNPSIKGSVTMTC